jgi:enoyl-CoA hydratase
VKAILKAVNGTLQLNQQEGLDLEAELFAGCCDTEDFKEGTLAFLEKRKAEFKHR